jgi:hypothetical protein
MQQQALGVGDELVLGGIRLTLLAVEGGEALFGIIPPPPGDEEGLANLPVLSAELWQELLIQAQEGAQQVEGRFQDALGRPLRQPRQQRQ